jgi:vancomycin resistance protein YoaR
MDMNLVRIRAKRGVGTLSKFYKFFIVLPTATLIFLAGVVIFLLGSRIFYTGKAFPGVQAAGVSLSGRTLENIESILSERLTYPTKGLIVFQDQQNLTITKPVDLGIHIDIPSMATNALSIGREGNLFKQFGEQFNAWFSGKVIHSIVVFDQQEAVDFLNQLALEVDRPKVEAHLSWEGMQVEARPGQIGRQLNIEATLAALDEPVTQMIDRQIDLVIEEVSPVILDVSPQADLIREILSEPLVLRAGEEDSWTIEPQELADMLHFNIIQAEDGAEYQVTLDKNQFIVRLTPLSIELDRPAENARFIFNDDTKQLDLLRPEVVGRKLDIEETITSIQQNLYAGNHEVALVFEVLEPQVKRDATAEELGITEAVSVVSTYFYDSGSARVHNISTAAAAFHGLLVAPGETLSMAKVLGDISLDTGYSEALIIYGESTIEGVGGGVCQVSTTLFRAAFFGGYPIVERYPHAYRVGYYELGPNSPGPGLDATVFIPIVDFKFTNDRSSWLLLETYIYGNQLLWKFYSAADGRQVEWSKKETNKTEAPDPLYKENPDLPKGEINQIEWQADGLDVTVDRTVIRDNQILYEDHFVTNYQPWRAIFEYGPGTKLPKDAKTE